MLQRLEKWIEQYGWASSFIIVVFFFLLFNVIATPLLNSGDDTFLMYTLGGGYGEAPTNLLHYNYGWHAGLGWIVKSLFATFPGVNWYTVILLLFHVAGCVCILYTLLKRTNFLVALFFFSSLFFFLETRQLLSLTFTGASLVAAAGAMCLLIHQFQQKRMVSANTIFAFLLLLLAGMLRMHIAWLVIILFASIAVTLLRRQQLLKLAASLIVMAGILWGLNKIHEQYYKNSIPGWVQQEKFRQALFYSYNKQLVNTPPAGTFTDSTEQQLFFAGFLYDSVKFNTDRITAISKQVTRNRSLANKEDRQGLYWFFIELRVYLLLFGATIILLLLQQKRLLIKNWLLCLLAFLAVHSVLFIYLKITIPIHLGLLLFLWLALAMQLGKTGRFFTHKKLVIPFAVILLLSTGWMGVRLIKENRVNKERYQRFLCATKELNQHTDKLFVVTDDAFPLNYFYIWNTPKQFPAANLLYKDRLITFTYWQTLQRFNITNLEEALVKNKNVFLLGKALPALEKGNLAATLSGPLPGYRCLEVRQLTPAE